MNPVFRTLRPAWPLLLALTAAGCASNGSHHAELAPQSLTPTEQFPIEVRQGPDEVLMKAHPGGLSPAQEQALAELAYRWRGQGGAAPITIHAPVVGGQPAGHQAVEASRGLLLSMGVAPEQLRVAAYEAAPDQPPVLRIGYPAYRALGPACGQDWENISRTGDNRPYSNFGCSVTANIAIQVANPRDFLVPTQEDPADATRRSVVLDKYRKGEVTAAAADSKAKGAVADAVKKD